MVCALYLHFPLCHSERSEESSRQAQFAPLDCHVATVVAPRNDIMVGHPHPIVRSREIPTVTVFPRNDKEKMEYSTCQSGCKIAVLCKNRRCGNCNAHKCALPRATLGFCTSTAQRICTISSSTDKNSCHNFVKLSAWWLAFARYFCCGNCNAHKCALPRATLGFCTSTAHNCLNCIAVKAIATVCHSEE